MARAPYPTDLTDAEYRCLEPHLPAPSGTGRPRLRPPREILDAIFYVIRSGCAWRLLPHEYPPWKTAYHYFRAWRLDGTWERLNAALREAAALPDVRRRAEEGGVLLRPMTPLSAPPPVDLAGKPVLLVSGAMDAIAPAETVAPLVERLQAAGARVRHETLPTGHGLTAGDLRLAQEALAG